MTGKCSLVLLSVCVCVKGKEMQQCHENAAAETEDCSNDREVQQ